MIRSIGKILFATGIAGFVAALIWWFMFFHQMLGENVKRASECFYRTTLECGVADAIGGVMDVPPYDPRLLWAAVALVVVGFLIAAFVPE